MLAQPDTRLHMKHSPHALSTCPAPNFCAQCGSLREEVGRLSEALRTQRDTTANLIGEARKRDSEWMQLTCTQLKEAVAKLDADVKEIRGLHMDLSNAHSSTSARWSATADGLTSRLSRQVDHLT